MSDLYVHLDAFSGRWDHRQENLITLGQHLVENARTIRANGGLAFGREDMVDVPAPDVFEAGASVPRPPLAYGPEAGLPAAQGEDWPTYCRRAFGVYDHPAFMVWLQSPMWRKTDTSPEGAALRIAYVLDYGVPHDFVEIAMGQSHSDYDRNGFLWEKLDMLPPDDLGQHVFARRRSRPEWVGAVELDQRRAAAKADGLILPGEVPFAAGLPRDEIARLIEWLGPIPDSYNDFLLLSGRRVSRDGDGPYANRLDAINRLARKRIFTGEREQDDPVPRDAIFIGLHEGANPEFILAGKRRDSLVFRFDAETGHVTQIAFSVFNWAEDFMSGVVPVEPPLDDAQPPGKARTSILGWLRGLFR